MALLLLAGAIVLALGGCALVDFGGRRDALLDDAKARGWVASPRVGKVLPLLALHSPHPAGSSTLTVYIEGDGIGWRDRYTPSRDPTPLHPVGLRLALADPAPDVLYLGRPCQYQDLATAPKCTVEYWTSHRLASDVIASLSAAIDEAKAADGARDIELIGFSGGGAAAALLAAERRDVRFFATVAADLDLDAWTKLHGVAPLSGSEDPARSAALTARVPQYHWVGAEDDVVPPEIVRSFTDQEGLSAASSVEVVQGYDHDCCWHREWGARIAKRRAVLASQPTR